MTSRRARTSGLVLVAGISRVLSSSPGSSRRSYSDSGAGLPLEQRLEGIAGAAMGTRRTRHSFLSGLGLDASEVPRNDIRQPGDLTRPRGEIRGCSGDRDGPAGGRGGPDLGHGRDLPRQEEDLSRSAARAARASRSRPPSSARRTSSRSIPRRSRARRMSVASVGSTSGSTASTTPCRASSSSTPGARWLRSASSRGPRRRMSGRLCRGPVAQWQSSRLLICGFRVQVPAGSPRLWPAHAVFPRTGTEVSQLVRTHHDHRPWPVPDDSPIAFGLSARDISGTLRRGAPGAIGASATDLRSDAGAENRRLRRSRSRVTNRATMIHRPRLGTRPAGLIAPSSSQSPRSN